MYEAGFIFTKLSESMHLHRRRTTAPPWSLNFCLHAFLTGSVQHKQHSESPLQPISLASLSISF